MSVIKVQELNSFYLRLVKQDAKRWLKYQWVGLEPRRRGFRKLLISSVYCTPE